MHASRSIGGGGAAGELAKYQAVCPSMVASLSCCTVFSVRSTAVPSARTTMPPHCPVLRGVSVNPRRSKRMLLAGSSGRGGGGGATGGRGGSFGGGGLVGGWGGSDGGRMP